MEKSGEIIEGIVFGKDGDITLTEKLYRVSETSTC
jgi:hypothetical protein